MHNSSHDQPSLKSNFAINLRRLCAFQASVAQVCRDLGTNRTQFNRYLSGKTSPSSNMMLRICKHFGVSELDIHLPPDIFENKVLETDGRKASGPLQLAMSEELAQQSKSALRGYLGFYELFYNSMSKPGCLVRAVLHVFAERHGISFSWIERDPDLGQPTPRWRYKGQVFHLRDRLFLVGLETITRNEIVEVVLFPSFRSKVMRLNGLILGVSSGDRREINCSRVIIDRMGPRVSIRAAIRNCRIIPRDHSSIPKFVLEAVSTPSVDPATNLFTAS